LAGAGIKSSNSIFTQLMRYPEVQKPVKQMREWVASFATPFHAPHRFMKPVSDQQSRRLRCWLGQCVLALACLYLLLLISEATPPAPKGAGQQAFAWKRDAFWSELESKFREARALDGTIRSRRFDQLFEELNRALHPLDGNQSGPKAVLFEGEVKGLKSLAAGHLKKVCPVPPKGEFLNPEAHNSLSYGE
jgi:hypothetical protein